jgi:hypothetical protein
LTEVQSSKSTYIFSTVSFYFKQFPQEDAQGGEFVDIFKILLYIASFRQNSREPPTMRQGEDISRKDYGHKYEDDKQ